MRAFACTILFALSGVAIASDGNSEEDHWNPGAEEGNDVSEDEETDVGAGDDASEPEDDETIPGMEEEGDDQPDADADPVLEEEPAGIDEEEDSIEDDGPVGSVEEPTFDWNGDAQLVAIIDARTIRDWEGVVRGMPRHGPVAIYSLEDTSMFEYDVSSVYAMWYGGFESFGPTPVDHPAAQLQIDDLAVLVTTEAYADSLVDFVHSFDGDYPQDMVLVDGRYLSAEVDGAYAVVIPDEDADLVFGSRPLCPGYAWVPVRADAADYVLAPPDHDSSFAIVDSPWTEPNGWFGLDLGEGWEDDAAWLANAPFYALEDQVNAGTPDEADEDQEDPGADHREDEERAANDNPHDEEQVEEPEQRDRPEREGSDPVVPNNPTRPGFGF